MVHLGKKRGGVHRQTKTGGTYARTGQERWAPWFIGLRVVRLGRDGHHVRKRLEEVGIKLG